MIANQLIQQIQRLAAVDSIDPATYQQALHFITENSDRLCDRKNMRGHLSASAYVIQSGQMWFIKHPYLHTILLPAGHVEPGETPLMTAQREYREETGFATHSLGDSLHGLRDVNIIAIPANPLKHEGAHFHVDFRYQLVISSQQRSLAELPSFLVARSEAPAEFHKYFDLNWDIK